MPDLFSSVLEEIFRGLNWKGKGIKINGRYVNNLREIRREKIKEMFEEYISDSRAAGLINNIQKTKYMGNRWRWFYNRYCRNK